MKGITIVATWLLLTVSPALGQTPRPALAESTVVITLGTGTPRPLPDVMGPATAVVVGERVFLFDAGVAVERRLAGAGLPTNGVTAAFITHLHSDHVLGLPDLIFSSWMFGRTRPFPVYGPAGLKPMIEHLYEAFREDIANRESEYGVRGGYQVEPRAIRPGLVFDSGGVRVTAFNVLHGQWREAYGYRIDTPTRSIVISGDTRPGEELVRMATGVDILIHEVHPASVRQIGNRPSVDWPRYISEHHTTSIQLGELAARAKPKLLIVYHNSRRVTADELIADIRKSFAGAIAIAGDLQRF